MNAVNNINTKMNDVKPGTYIAGFILATVLTAISFSFILINGLSREFIIIGIIVSAIIQMIVHLHFFLHLDRSSAKRWNMLAFAFTAILLFIFIGGTIWVMYTLNYRMM